MDDGSLQKDKKTMILHTQGYKGDEIMLLSKELNEKFKLESKVISHKEKYKVIEIPRKNNKELVKLIEGYIHEEMKYKLKT